MRHSLHTDAQTHQTDCREHYESRDWRIRARRIKRYPNLSVSESELNNFLQNAGQF